MTRAPVSNRKHEVGPDTCGAAGANACGEESLSLADTRLMDGRVRPGHDDETRGNPLAIFRQPRRTIRLVLPPPPSAVPLPRFTGEEPRGTPPEFSEVRMGTPHPVRGKL